MRFIRYSGPEPSKHQYLSHSKNESFLLQTLPSFFAAYRSKKGQNIDFFNEWMLYKTQQSDIMNISRSGSLSEDIKITWLGHASFVIHLGKTTIITDPVFWHIPLFSRLSSCSFFIENLPPADAVLLSHNHPDHMDHASLACVAYKNKNTAFLVPRGDKKWLTAPYFRSVMEHSWHDQTILPEKNGDIILTFLPSYHWSRHSLFDTNISLWGSWLIQWKNHVIYFAGDSAYFNHFAEIGSRYKVSVALLPIAPIQPKEWMLRSHMSPEIAGKAFFDLGAQLFIPMHWGTFHFGIDQFQDPVDHLQKWENDNQEQLKRENKKITILKIGQMLEL